MVRLDAQCAEKKCHLLPEWAEPMLEARLCGLHRTEGMVFKAGCLAAGCDKPRECGFCDGALQFCALHQIPGMILETTKPVYRHVQVQQGNSDKMNKITATLARYHRLLLSAVESERQDNYTQSLVNTKNAKYSSLMLNCTKHLEDSACAEHAEDHGGYCLDKANRRRKFLAAKEEFSTTRQKRRFEFLGNEDDKKTLLAQKEWDNYEQTLSTYQDSCHRHLKRGKRVETAFIESMKTSLSDILEDLQQLKKVNRGVRIQEIVEVDMKKAYDLMELEYRLDNVQHTPTFDFSKRTFNDETIPQSSEFRDKGLRFKKKQEDTENRLQALKAAMEHSALDETQAAFEQIIQLCKTKASAMGNTMERHMSVANKYQIMESAITDLAQKDECNDRMKGYREDGQAAYTEVLKLQSMMKNCAENKDIIISKQWPKIIELSTQLQALYVKKLAVIKKETERLDKMIKICSKWSPSEILSAVQNLTDEGAGFG